MVGRVGVQGLELVFVLAQAEVARPGASVGAWQVVAQHVHDADCGERGAEEVRTLIQSCSDQETPVAAPLDRQLLGRGVALADQVLGGGDEVVEDVLLLELGTGSVPALAVLAAATKVGDGENAAHLQPDESIRPEAGSHRDVEAAVAVEHGGVTAIEIDAVSMGDEHRHLGAVTTLVEHLSRLEAVELCVDLRSAKQAPLSGGDIVAIDLVRKGEAGEGIEGLRVVGLAGEPAGGAESGKIDVSDGRTVEVEDLDRAAGILEIEGHESISD